MKAKSIIENLENIALNFEKMNNDYVFMKEKLVGFDFEENYDKININFRECHIAIAKNGGLIGICKKKGFLDITRGSKINNYILVTYQNLKKRYLIPIDWNYKERWVIDLEFNEKEQLYAICNDGIIFKIDILTQKALQKKSSEFFKNQAIIKAKLVENGFIALTVDNNFVYVNDIKDPIPKILFPISLLNFSTNVDFLAIPPSKSKSKKLELLITNERGDGLIHIEETDGDGQFSLIPVEGSKQMECKGASIIIKNRVETYYLNVEESKEPEAPEPGSHYEKLGKIAALAISPKKDQLAIYDPRGIVFFFYSTFEEGGERKKALIQLNEHEEYSSEELTEMQKVLNFEEGCQFLYCGEDAVAIVGYRYIFIVNTLSRPLIFKITEEEEKIYQNFVLCKCISEVDGLRYITNEGIFFISRVPKELMEVCYPFSDNPSMKLLNAYQSSLDKETNSEKKIREIKYNLAESIYNLQIAAGSIIWNKNGGKDEQEKKEGQLFLLEAAQHAKCFVRKEEFNFDKFYERCKQIRIVNNLRNHSYKPKLITYKEYLSLNSPKDLILKLIRSLNFGIAFKIAQYLEEDIKLVHERYAIACIKKISNSCNEEEGKIFDLLNEKLKTVKNFSYIKLAKKSFKYHKDIIGLKFLENEKSLLAKLPKYIDKEEWDKVLELSENIIDYNILMSIIDKIFKKTTLSDFVQIAGRHPGSKSYIFDFLNKNAPEKLDDYMKLLKTPEEMFFFALEQYFQSTKYTDREKYITMARENQKLIDNSVNPIFDHRFYRSYVDFLESNLSFKIDILNIDTAVIPKPDDTSFDISVYDTYKFAVKAEKIGWVESQNKKFGLSIEGVNIMKFMTYGENNKLGEIEAMIKKNSLKKLNLTNLNLAEIYYKFKGNREASEYIKNITEPFYFEYKIDMLKHMEMLDVALEVIITDKHIENMADFINDIISKKPKLLRKAKEIAEKNKIALNIETSN